MSRQSLPQFDPARTEFGFARTVCSCSACASYCRRMPGYLVPGDLERIRNSLIDDAQFLEWAKNYIRASPGALVVDRGRTFRIPTLVPATRSSGACIFLSADARCGIHASAPYGCAFFDSHMDAKTVHARSRRGLESVIADLTAKGIYYRVWLCLHVLGLRAPGPAVTRRDHIGNTNKGLRCRRFPPRPRDGRREVN